MPEVRVLGGFGKRVNGWSMFEGRSLRAVQKSKSKRKGLPDGYKRGLMDKWGLEPNCVLVGLGGQRFVFWRVGGLSVDRERPWVWAYKLKGNGTTYSEPTRLDRWEKA